MVPICVSPRNLLHTRLMMEEKGKVINIETEEEEEDLEDLIIEEYKDEGTEEENEPTHPLTKLHAPDPTPPRQHHFLGHTPRMGA